MIGGYESAFLVDLVASSPFEKSKANFHPITYHRIYIDDVLVVFTGNRSKKYFKDWLNKFQKTVNNAAGNKYLQFTAEICATEKNSPTAVKEGRVQILTNEKFPFLDMKMS